MTRKAFKRGKTVSLAKGWVEYEVRACAFRAEAFVELSKSSSGNVFLTLPGSGLRILKNSWNSRFKFVSMQSDENKPSHRSTQSAPAAFTRLSPT